MNLTFVRGDNAAVIVGGSWIVEFYTEEDGHTVGSTPTMSVTDPDGVVTAPDSTYDTNGVYQYEIPITKEGRYLAGVESDEFVGARYISAYALTVTQPGEMPQEADVVNYLGQRASYTISDVRDALRAESAAQRAKCYIPAAYPDDLREALLRRCHRNLSMRNAPHYEDNDLGQPITPTNDPEVRRLEGPWRKLTIG